MEEQLAILMADLSGYTALTEAHGSISAADMIDKYVEIAESCLVNDCRLHERNGDEIMVVSASPDALLETTHLIAEATMKEENFLLVHGGLHIGSVLKRGQSYFGSAINLTARIASKAEAGTFCCSAVFANAIGDRSRLALRSKGYGQFKNVAEAMEIFELTFNDVPSFKVDPVCRMLLLDIRNAIAHPEDKDTYFCSSHCRDIYIATHASIHQKQSSS